MSNTTFIYSLDHLAIDENTTKKDLLRMLKEHDYNSFIFSFFTGAFNYALSKELGINDKQAELHFQSGLFHDIGKLGMEHAFINYEGKFKVSMYNEMKKHTTGGGEVLKKAKDIEQELIDTAMHHHNNYDGSGYPGGLIEDEIPFVARLTRISDSIDAYLSKRCYKDGGPAREAFDDLNQYKGTSYDPTMIDALERIHNRIMDACRRMGQERPSKSLYENCLIDFYLNDLQVKKADDILKYI